MKLFERLHLRWRRWRVCSKLDIKPYPWQLEFALGLTDRLNYPPGRQTGKTMAVMLRLLIMTDYPAFCLFGNALYKDPDFRPEYKQIVDMYCRNYETLARTCGVKARYSSYFSLLHRFWQDPLERGEVFK